MNENYVTLTIGKQKNIALIAHDNKKAELIAFCIIMYLRRFGSRMGGFVRRADKSQ